MSRQTWLRNTRLQRKIYVRTTRSDMKEQPISIVLDTFLEKAMRSVHLLEVVVRDV